MVQKIQCVYHGVLDIRHVLLFSDQVGALETGRKG